MTDRLTQRELLNELRVAVDRAMRDPQPRWVEAVVTLRRDNPRGMRSSHITHNLGEPRRTWLAQLDVTLSDTNGGPR